MANSGKLLLWRPELAAASGRSRKFELRNEPDLSPGILTYSCCTVVGRAAGKTSDNSDPRELRLAKTRFCARSD